MNDKKEYNVFSSIEGVDVELEVVLFGTPSGDEDMDEARGVFRGDVCPAYININYIDYIRPEFVDDTPSETRSCVTLRSGKDITVNMNYKELFALKHDLLKKWRGGAL